MLKITRDIIDDIVAHGELEAPLEACGYLAEKNGVICKSIAMKNVDASPIHYSMDPKEQFATIRRIREMGMEVAGVYHSHPETPARPSVEDMRLAFDPNMTYVIVSLMAGVDPVLAYKINKGQVSNVRLEVVDN